MTDPKPPQESQNPRSHPNQEEQVRELVDLAAFGYGAKVVRRNRNVVNATKSLLKLIEQAETAARCDENQYWLDRIEANKGKSETHRYGSASGAMEVASFEQGHKDRIQELKGVSE